MHEKVKRDALSAAYGEAIYSRERARESFCAWAMCLGIVQLGDGRVLFLLAAAVLSQHVLSLGILGLVLRDYMQLIIA